MVCAIPQANWRQMDPHFFQKLAIINKLIGETAPLGSKLRAFLTMHNPKPEDVIAATDLALKAIQMDAYGLGWNTEISQAVDGPGSPSITVTVGEVIDRYNLSYFLQDTEDNGRLLSDEWLTLINTTK